MNGPVNAPTRRGACPGLSAPMATGDGLLARLTPAGSIPVPGFAGLCASARRQWMRYFTAPGTAAHLTEVSVDSAPPIVTLSGAAGAEATVCPRRL